MFSFRSVVSPHSYHSTPSYWRVDKHRLPACHNNKAHSADSCTGSSKGKAHGRWFVYHFLQRLGQLCCVKMESRHFQDWIWVFRERSSFWFKKKKNFFKLKCTSSNVAEYRFFFPVKEKGPLKLTRVFTIIAEPDALGKYKKWITRVFYPQLFGAKDQILFFPKKTNKNKTRLCSVLTKTKVKRSSSPTKMQTVLFFFTCCSFQFVKTFL